MANRICSICRATDATDPTLATVHFEVYVDRLEPGTEIRGQVTGPRCVYATTVEVAYPVREYARSEASDDEPSISCEVLIPEPSLWEPPTPFLYEGRLELWGNGQCHDQTTFQFGLSDLQFQAKGLRVNGRRFALRGVARDQFVPEDLPGLRQAGFNTLLTFPNPDSSALWETADRLGFFILSRIWSQERVPCVKRLCLHPSALAWVVAAAMENPLLLALMTSLAQVESGQARLSIELSSRPSTVVPIFQSVVCDELLLADLNSIPAPKLVLLNRTSIGEPESQELLATPGVCGWVLEPFL